MNAESESESHFTTDNQLVSLSWHKAPIWGLRPDLYYCLTVMVLFFVGALSDERMGLSFVYAAGPFQRSLSEVRGPWYLRQYITVSNLRLPFLSPPTTRRVTVEVFELASTWAESITCPTFITLGRTECKSPPTVPLLFCVYPLLRKRVFIS
jgi:hypothetical protein